MRTPRINDSVGSALRSAGSQLSALGEHYQRQQEATQSLQARQGFLELQNTLQQDYRATMESAPETGEGVYDGWFVGNEQEAGLFDQRATEFISGVPQHLQQEYQARLTAMRGEYDDRIAREELGLRQQFAGTVIGQQLDASALAVGQNPEVLDQQIEDNLAFIGASALPRAQREALARQATETLTSSAIETQIRQNPEEWQRQISDHITAAGTGGDAVSILVDQIIEAESAGNPTARNPLSSATGAGQFIADTWMQFVREERPDLAQGRSRSQILALRNDYQLSREATTWYARSNERYLQRHGLPITPGNLYLAHFAGPEGAREVLQANPGASVRSVLGANVVRSNPFLRGRSVQWAINWAAEKMGSVNFVPTAQQEEGAGQINPMLARVTPATLIELQSFTQDVLDDRSAMRTEQAGELRESLDLRIATGDPSLTLEEILSSDLLDDGQKATLTRSFNRSRSEQMTAREFGLRMEFGDTFDPFSTDERNGVSANYDSRVQGERIMESDRARHILMDTVTRSGIMPESAFNELRRASQSTDPEQIARAGAIADAIYRQESGSGQTAITSRTGGSDIERLATQFNHYRQRGYTQQEAAEIIAGLNDPAVMERREAILGSPAVRDAIDDIDEADVLQVFDRGLLDIGPSNLGQTPEASAIIQGEYISVFREEIVRANGDVDLAEEMAGQRIRSIYGESQLALADGGTVLRYPPEVTYPPVGGSHDYIAEQLAEAAQEAGLGDEVRLQYDDLTEEQVRRGEVPSYQVWTETDGIWERTPDRFVANPSAALERWRSENLGQSREQSGQLRETLDGMQENAEWLEQRGQHMIPVPEGAQQ